DSRRRPPDRGAGAGIHAVHLRGVRADVPAVGRVALPVRTTGRGGGVCDAGVLRAVADAGADAGDVLVAKARAAAPGCAPEQPVPAFPARLRAPLHSVS